MFIVGSKRGIFAAIVRIGRSRSSKVDDFGINRKRIWTPYYSVIVTRRKLESSSTDYGPRTDAGIMGMQSDSSQDRLLQRCAPRAPPGTTHKLQRVQNNAARIVHQAPRRSHAHPLLKEVAFVASGEAYHLQAGRTDVQDTAYVSTGVSHYNLSRHIRARSGTRSSAVPFLDVPFSHTDIGKRSFSSAEPATWTLCLLLSSNVTLSLYLNLGQKLTCSILLIASSAVPPARLKLRHYGALQMYYYYYYYYYYC